MKNLLIASLIGLSSALLLTGCLNLQLGGGTSTKGQAPTEGQQLTDLQHAKEVGAITEAEYQAQKAKILNR
jgi:hypothetical protein